MMIGTDLRAAKDLLKANQLVAIPTETVYGLAANALSEAAVLSIFQVKNRPAFDPLIVHTHSLAALRQWVRELPPAAEALAEAFMPGPLTLLLPKNPLIPDLVTSGLDTVAIRLPAHPLTQALLASLPFPLAAPSANPFGYISPTTAQHVAKQLGTQIPYILDGGPCTVGLESTIVRCDAEGVTVLRKGGLSVEAIEAVVGPVAVQAVSSSNPLAPGMLKSHYSPRIPLILRNLSEIHPERSERFGVLSFQKNWGVEQQEILSPSGDLAEAARRLFAAMRRLDALDLEVIYAELVPDEGLGRAINDRLKRAAAEE
jgi:L-threonylcarbamoyladenylate synthase